MERYNYSSEQRTLLEKNPLPFAIYQFIDKRVVTLILSDGFCELFGYTDRGKAYHDMDYDMYFAAYPNDIARISNAAYSFMAEGEKYDVIYRTKMINDSEYHIIHAVGKHVYTESGVRLAYVWYMDLGLYTGKTESLESVPTIALDKELHDECVLKASHYDFLTGMPSLTYFFELAEAGISDIQKSGRSAVLLYMDLCGMKYFNTKRGFSEGDKLLRSFSLLLAATFKNENCCRVGGDRFVVYTEEDNLEDILRSFFREWRGKDRTFTLPVHVGIYPIRTETGPISDAFDRAKITCDALYNVYGSCFNYYREELRDDEEHRQYILSNLDRAIEEKWIRVYYQPIVRAISGRVCDEEALARWVDPEKGLLPPGEFIPYLEDAGLIYKLDLCILEQVLEKIKITEKAGLYIVPQSINLSRSDFDSCDIVEEIRKRVDAAEVSRDRITIEITESIIGPDFDFIKKQIERFRELGFPVWMDDFGSGYSSLHVLQAIRFELLKFDMSFLRRLDEGDTGLILLRELMKLASSLGLNTVCEGVETQEQVSFLQDIGCSKLQGYFYTRPIPLEKVMERYEKGIQIGFENPEETDYYETIGRVDLYNLSVIVNGEDSILQNTYNTVPVGVMEIIDGKAKFVRCNQSYRDFMNRMFQFDLSNERARFSGTPTGPGEEFMNNVKKCCETGQHVFVDEKMPNGTLVHFFIRRLAVNPVNGTIAVAVAVLSVSKEAG